jgi:cell division protein FtsL
MAQALRTIILQPEEPQEQQSSPQLPQRRRRASFTGWAKLAFTLLVVTCGVSALVTFVRTYARIAEYEMRCQALKQEYTELNRQSIELNLELERLATQTRLDQVAQEQHMQIPEASQVHYLQGKADYPNIVVARTAPNRSWARRSGQQVMAALGSAWQVLGGDTTNTAYAQD